MNSEVQKPSEMGWWSRMAPAWARSSGLRICKTSLLIFMMGCSSSTPSTPQEKPTFSVNGSVIKRQEYPPADRMVVLLFNRSHAQFLQARAALNASQPTTIWPHELLQRLVSQLQDQEPVACAVTDSLGEFELPKRIPAGTYVLSVGIPTRRDTGASLPKEWPASLHRKTTITLLGRELTVPTRSAWLTEVKITEDRRVNLDQHDFMSWPEHQPAPNELRAAQKQAEEIDRLGRDFAALDTQRNNADQKARATGQPLHVKALRELEAKATALIEKRGAAVTRLDEMIQSLCPESEIGQNIAIDAPGR